MTLDLPVIPTFTPPPPPSSLVVRYGYLRYLGEFPYDGNTRPGCGAKCVIRTKRGTEMAEVVTTTCTNGGCAKSVTRDKLYEYIENSGGRDYPFTTEGRVLRMATVEDMAEHSRLESEKPNYVATAKTLVRELDMPMKLVEVELLLGREMATFFFRSEHRVDFRQLVKHLAAKFKTRIQMHQVGARDEARVVADYETCGQHCCCKQFLKVLKPISMGAAKMQKATLDPNKISGRCGRLKCCLRYEEDTYEELRKKLPRINSRVRTAEGVGVVVETMILTQLVKVELESGRWVAVANEELLERDLPAAPRKPIEQRPPADPKPEDRQPPPRPTQPEQRPRPDQRPPSPPQQRQQPEPRRESRPAPAPTPQQQPRPTFEQFVEETISEPVADSDPRAHEEDETPAAPKQPGVGAMGRRRRRRGGRGRGPAEGGQPPQQPPPRP